jgi:hypothetical protein
MKHGYRDEEPYFLGVDERPQSLSYARDLRAIGQALEDKNLTSFALEVEAGSYVARGTRLEPDSGWSLVGGLRDLVSSLTGGSRRSSNEVELRFTADGIDRIEDGGRAKRRDSHSTPDAHSVSQLLRGAGAYLDRRRNVSLLGITVEDRWVTLRYVNADGRIEQTKQDLEFFYNYWVKMYLQRRNRGATCRFQN